MSECRPAQHIPFNRDLTEPRRELAGILTGALTGNLLGAEGVGQAIPEGAGPSLHSAGAPDCEDQTCWTSACVLKCIDGMGWELTQGQYWIWLTVTSLGDLYL